MILQTLYEYYERKMTDPDPDQRLPRFGFEDKEIPFIIELEKSGRFINIKDTRRDEGKRKVGKKYSVPKGVKKTSGILANLLWETAEYALGLDTKGKPDRVAQQHAAFRERILNLPPMVREDEGIVALLAFLDSDPLKALAKEPCWDELCETNPIVSFRLLEENNLICERPAITSLKKERDNIDSLGSVCLVTGMISPPERLHTAIKGVWGAQTSGANIVSFNLDAFNSYGKKQGNNAPVSAHANFAYTTALNHLLARGSRQRIQVGDASAVFWAQKADDLEDSFSSFFGDGDIDNPDARTEQIRALLNAVDSGKFDGGRGENRFHILGLSPNAARISIRFWHNAPLSELSSKIANWFADLILVRGPNDSEFPSLFRLLLAVSVLQKADNIPPNLGGDIIRSIFDGSPFPMSWLNAAVIRCRAEQHVSYLRASAIKACLNRTIRRNNIEKEFLPMLDVENVNTSYRLGRLFAILERFQEESNAGINSTIRDRFYSSASSTPVIAFPSLLRLKTSHEKKLRSQAPGKAIWLEKMVSEVLGEIKDFPTYLSLSDQGRFALGYYHQRQSFFTKKIENQNTTSTAN